MGLRFLSVLCLVLSTVFSLEIGCLRLCGPRSANCITNCENAIQSYPEFYNSQNWTTHLVARPIARVENDIDITGGDIFTYTASGMQILTSRDGRLFRFLPNPKPGQTVLTEFYRIPESLNLDTNGNKGLYDVTFPRDFNRTRLMYLYFSTYPSNAIHDHDNVVAEFKFDCKKLSAEFVQVVHRMPQISPTRSGGTLKVGKSVSEAEFAPLWLTSGSQPSIYAIFPESMKESNQHYTSVHGNSVKVWATNLNNPTECDYAPMRDSTQFYCLDERYDESGIRDYVVVQGVTNTLTTGAIDVREVSTTSGTTFTTTDSNKRRQIDRKIYAPAYGSYSRNKCMPDSLVYSFDNLLSEGYRSRLIIALPVCEAEKFQQARLAMLMRSTKSGTKVFVDMPVDFGEELLVDFHLMGTERSRGLFFIATQISTGHKDLYQVKQRNMYSSESGTVETFGSSFWTTT